MGSPKLRLIELPPAFMGVDAFRHFEWTSLYGNKMLSQWVKQGSLERLGPRLDVYVQCARVPEPERLDTLLEALPTGHFRMDPNVIRQYSWTTQISHKREEVIPSLTRDCEPRKDLTLYARSRRWWSMISPGLRLDEGSNSMGIGPHIHPAWSLAEALCNSTCGWWRTAPDDLDFDMMALDGAYDELKSALQACGQYYKITWPPSMWTGVPDIERLYNEAYDTVVSITPTASSPANN